MAVLNLTVDTEAKTCELVIDGGTPITDVASVFVHKSGSNGDKYENVDVEIALRPNKENGVTTFRKIVASKSKKGDEVKEKGSYAFVSSDEHLLEYEDESDLSDAAFFMMNKKRS